MSAQAAGGIIQAGASILGGILQGQAAKKAAKIQVGAQQAARQDRELGFSRAQSLYAPGVAANYTGMNALTNRMGLPRQAMQTAVQTAQPKGGIDPAAYLAANPDVLAEFYKISPKNMQNNLGIDPTPEAFAAWHWKQYGQFEPNRQTAPATSNALTGA